MKKVVIVLAIMVACTLGIASMAIQSDQQSAETQEVVQVQVEGMDDCGGCGNTADCGNCDDCADCEDMVECADCIDMVECADCADMAECADCEDCEECADCEDCDDKGDCGMTGIAINQIAGGCCER